MRRLIYALVPLSLPLMGCVQTSPYEPEIAELQAQEAQELGLTGLPVAEEIELGRQVAELLRIVAAEPVGALRPDTLSRFSLPGLLLRVNTSRARVEVVDELCAAQCLAHARHRRPQ